MGGNGANTYAHEGTEEKKDKKKYPQETPLLL